MILYHWTQRHNLTSIFYNGLDPRWATGRTSVVWLASRAAALGLADCVSRTHEVQRHKLCLLRVNVSRASLWTWAVKGVYRSPQLILPECLQWVSPAVLFEHQPIRIARTQSRQ